MSLIYITKEHIRTKKRTLCSRGGTLAFPWWNTSVPAVEHLDAYLWDHMHRGRPSIAYGPAP